MMDSRQYGLKEETINQIKQVFKKYEEVEEAILYGSRAKGNHKPGSDIDVTLEGKNLNLRLLNKISLELDDLPIPYTVELSIYSYIENPDLIAHIERVGRSFYKAGEETPS